MPGTTLPPSIDDLAQRLPAFCQRHGIARVEVFGSVATGEAKPGSDLDLNGYF
jgi:predicted nucleotidyltransferase